MEFHRKPMMDIPDPLGIGQRLALTLRDRYKGYVAVLLEERTQVMHMDRTVQCTYAGASTAPYKRKMYVVTMEMKNVKLRQLAEDEFQQMNVMRQSLTTGAVPPESLLTGGHETGGGM
jgi:hypothetical protein